MTYLQLHALVKCPQIQLLDLSKNTLTDCVKDLLSKMIHLNLNRLDLVETKMSRADVMNVASSMQSGNFPQIKHMILSGNTLTDCLGELFKADYPNLEYLWLDNTSLSNNDIKSLSEAVQHGTLPKLNQLDLSNNILANYIHTVLGPSLEDLQLNTTELTKDDIKSLCTAVRQGRLPKLKRLDVSGNILTNCLDTLMNADDLSLGLLEISNAKLSKGDVKSLSTAVRGGRLPELMILDLSNNILTNCLQDLFNDNHRFLQLETLCLNRTQLNRTNLVYLTEALKSNKLRRLE